MSEIRITYSGLISLIIGIATILVGLVYTFVITRTLSPKDFGTWGLINSLFVYVVILEPMISYWVTRDVARDIKSGKTAIMSNGMISIGAILVYLIIIHFVGVQANVDTNVLVFASILIPLIFLNNTMTAITLGWKPHAVSYGTLSYGLAQIPMVLFFVYFLKLQLVGVIISSLFSFICSITVLIICSRNQLKNAIRKEFFKRWMRLFWLPVYQGIAGMIFYLDVVIFSLITGSVIGVAFLSAAKVVPNFVTSSALVSRAIYPKLLRGGDNVYLKENITLLFYFAILFATISITFAHPILFALNPFYEVAVPVVIFMTLQIFLNTLSTVFQSLITGKEKVDVNEKILFMEYIRSKLFFIPTLMIVQYGTYIGLLALVLLLLISNGTSQIDLVIYWSIVGLIIQIPFTIYYYLLVRKNFNSVFHMKSILKYLFVGMGVFGTVYVLMENYLHFVSNIFVFLPNLLLYVAIGVGLYVLITYSIDLRTRKLVSAIIAEIKNR